MHRDVAGLPRDAGCLPQRIALVIVPRRRRDAAMAHP